MKITVITGSPHRRGTSSLLADRFVEGAMDAGHEVFRFDSAFEKVSPCLGCGRCETVGKPCVHQDAMEELNPHLLSAELVVFVTPLYYYGMCAQIKMVIDRFYANNSKLMGSGKKAMLLAASYDANDWTMRDLAAHYQTIVKYLKWSDAGMLLATGVGCREDVERTDYPNQAYQMGNAL